jgi:glycosyltransferase involved in cell wall biosynthesis
VPQPESRLRVALDATPLLGLRTGVGVFAEHALQSLGTRDDLDLSAFAVSWRRRRGIRDHLPPGVRAVDTPMPARPLHWSWGRRAFPPIEWFIGPQDVVHGTNYVVPPTRRAARVMTVHDLTSVRFPEMCDEYTRRFPALVRRALGEGAWVHTPSQYVAEEVIDLLGADRERVRAVHHGVPALDQPTNPSKPGTGPPVEGPYVLALGTVEPRKDLPTLVRAFDRVAGEAADVRLVVAGAEGWGAEAFRQALYSAKHRDRIVRLGFVSPSDRSALLRHAVVYAYPSLYEGFGLPPLEAMSVGVPVLTTTAGALPEVVGDAAVMTAPGDSDAMASALAQLLTDEALRRRLADSGRQRVDGYSWTRAAEGLARLYADASAARSGLAAPPPG